MMVMLIDIADCSELKIYV